MEGRVWSVAVREEKDWALVKSDGEGEDVEVHREGKVFRREFYGVFWENSVGRRAPHLASIRAAPITCD